MPPALVTAAIIGATALSYLVAMALDVPALVPILNVAAGFPFMVASLRRGRPAQAVGRMLLWAAALGVCATVLSYVDTARAGRLFIHGEQYRREMFEFIVTGAGAEGDIRRFLPQHATHAAVFCALALGTGGLLAMPLGAVLMNYMSYYVGALGASSVHPWRAMALAWVPWAVIRIGAFVTLGVILAGPVLGRVAGFEYHLGKETRWMLLASAGLLGDVALKWALAGSWRDMIRAAAGW